MKILYVVKAGASGVCGKMEFNKIQAVIESLEPSTEG
jgi:hypothetical protein